MTDISGRLPRADATNARAASARVTRRVGIRPSPTTPNVSLMIPLRPNSFDNRRPRKSDGISRE